MTIQELQTYIRTQAEPFTDRTLERRLIYLTQEVGEVARELLKLADANTARGGRDLDQIKNDIGLEIYDVFWNLCDLANLLDIDLEHAFSKKMEINKNRW